MSKFAQTEDLGVAEAPDGGFYWLHFYGEDEGAAVVEGPIPSGEGGLVEVPEVYREAADSAAEARAKLQTWALARGWKILPG